MKYTFYPFVLLLALLSHATLFAGEIRTGAPDTRLKYVDQGNYHSLTFTSSVSSIQFREVLTKQGPFTELFVRDHFHSVRTGEPDLPSLCRLIEVPVNAGFEIIVTDSAWTDYDLGTLGITRPVIPLQPSVSKGVTDPSSLPFFFNEGVYQENRFTGSPLVTVSGTGTLRSMNLAHLTVNPVRYNPVTHTLRVFTSITAKVVFNGANEGATRAMKAKYGSPWFNSLSRLVDNDLPGSDSLITSSPATYVIVAPYDYRDALKPLIRWKTRKGFRVIEAYTNNPLVGNTTSSIKSYLQDLYNNPPTGFNPPSFALFVGDVAQIPAWTSGGQATDLRYCEYSGDNLPEVIYGRFSAVNVAQVQAYVDKTVEYEQYLFPDDTFLNEVVMVAGYDGGGNGLTYGNGQINYGTAYYFNSAHNLASHTYLQPEPAGANYSQQIRNNISDGVGYSNYTAHGSEDGWADPEFVISQIPALQNAHKYSLMVGNCCLTSRYNVNCFAEEVTRAANKGALGYIGASNNSLWDEDYWWGCGLKAVTTSPVYDPLHLGAYDVTFHDHGEPVAEWFTTMGQMFVGGNLAVQQSNSSNKLYYWEIYNLMGDPSLSIYYSVPPPVAATLPQILLIGTGTCSVVTEPWASVAISLNDSTLLDAGMADSSGIVNLQYEPLTMPGYARFVVTKQNRKPLIDSVLIIQPTGPYITLASATVNDSLGGNNNKKADYDETISLNLLVSNVGMAATENLVATISSPDTNVIIEVGNCTFGVVQPDSSATLAGAFRIRIKNNVADQHKVTFGLIFTEASSSWTGTCQVVLQAPLLVVGNILVSDPQPGGNSNGSLDPGETAILKVRVNNNGHSPVTNAHGTMNIMPGSGSFILLNNNTSFIGSVSAGGMNEAVFTAVANGITPPGTTVNLDFDLIAGQYNQYGAGKELSLVIGQPPQYPMSNTTFSACSGTFFDSGGPGSNYPNNQDLITTIHAASPGAKLRAVFTQFDLEPSTSCSYDYLSIFNGPSIMDPLVGTYCGNTLPDTITSTSSVGSLTFMFHSDYQHNFAGWAASLKCMGGPMSLIANSFPASVCEGSSSQLVAIVNGGSGNYTYQWNPATYLDDPTSPSPISTPAGNITYTVTVYDGSNSLTSGPVEITVIPGPVPPVITLAGNQLVSSVPTGNQWYINGNLIPGATGQSYTPTSSGDYTATVSTNPGCESGPSNFITWLITGTDQVSGAPGVILFPNPATDRINLLLPPSVTGKVSAMITDATGRVIISKTLIKAASAGSGTFEINTARLTPGVYSCIVTTTQDISVQKFILVK